jgi:hypothetical protein
MPILLYRSKEGNGVTGGGGVLEIGIKTLSTGLDLSYTCAYPSQKTTSKDIKFPIIPYQASFSSRKISRFFCMSFSIYAFRRSTRSSIPRRRLFTSLTDRADTRQHAVCLHRSPVLTLSTMPVVEREATVAPLPRRGVLSK